MTIHVLVVDDSAVVRQAFSMMLAPQFTVDTAADPHHELPLVARTNDELAERELVPFRAALAAGARMVMTGHLALPGGTDDPPTSSTNP